MKIIHVCTGILFVILSGGIFGCTEETETLEIIYVGTFSGEGSEGLYAYGFDRETAELSHLQTVTDRESPNFQYIHPEGEYLYSVSREDFSDESPTHTVSAYQIDPQTGRLTLINEQSVEGRGPAHVSADPLGRFIYVSNYATGNLAVYPIREDGGIEEPSDVVQHEGSSVHPTRQSDPHLHSTVPSIDGKFIYASDLGLDRIMIYKPDPATGLLVAAEPFESTPGSGPRHFAFHPGGRFAYSAEELTSTVAVLKVDQDTGALEQIQRVDMLPEDFEGENSAADIHVSPDGRFLYASNRGHDSLVIYAIDESTGELSLVGHEPTRGGHPRDFMIDRRGDFVMVANRDNNNVVVFRRDSSTGVLSYTGTEIDVPMAVCVTQLILN